MAIKLFKDNIYVSLGSDLNIDRFAQLSSNEKFEEMQKPNGYIYFEVNTLKEASKLCRKFIQKFNLGSSNWSGGRVIDENNNFIAQVSYNGRIWDCEDWKLANEIME